MPKAYLLTHRNYFDNSQKRPKKPPFSGEFQGQQLVALTQRYAAHYDFYRIRSCDPLFRASKEAGP